MIALLQSFIHGTRPEVADPAALLRMAQMQNLLPVLAYMDKKWKLFSDETLRAQLGRQLRQTLFLHNQRYCAFEQLSDALSGAGIDHLPVKGWYLRHLYEVPELRTFGDIDILIRREDRARVHELMLAQGFTVQTDWEPTYTYCRGTELYELHTNLMDASLDDRSDLPAYFADAWTHAAPVRGRCHGPEETFHFLYTLCHLAKHLYTGGAGLRMYLDAALFIHRRGPELDWSAVRREMEELKLGRFLDTVLSCCESWFAVTAPCDFERVDAAQELLSYTLDADLFGKLRDKSVVQSRNRRESAESDGRASAVRRILFPPYKALVKRYTYIEGRKWLIPVALVHRAAVNVKNLTARTNAIRSIAATSREDVDAYDDFMNRIGL
ncbi:MAG: nucleotidyltransferase family protein [Oscillospiraceae bacterium]|nr:nucleotidyltransferase family protein [Oscillospiraceae bacterium]